MFYFIRFVHRLFLFPWNGTLYSFNQTLLFNSFPMDCVPSKFPWKSFNQASTHAENKLTFSLTHVVNRSTNQHILTDARWKLAGTCLKKGLFFQKKNCWLVELSTICCCCAHPPFPSGNVKKVRVVGERALTDWWFMAGMRGRKVGAIERQASSRHQQ